MILGPSPLFGRSSFYKGPINHLALNGAINPAGGQVTIDLKPRASVDGKRYRPILLSGDISKAKSTATPDGAFQPVRLVKFKGKFYLFGSLWRSTDAPESAVFASTDKRRWMKADTPFAAEGTVGADAFAGVAANGDYLAAIKPGGPLIWTDGDNWFGRNDLPLSGTGLRAYALGASAGGFVVAGQGASATTLITAPTPGGTWTARTHPFGSARVGPAETGDAVILFGTAQLITAPLTNLTTWSTIALPGSRSIAVARYAGGKWFAGGFGEWVTATAAGGPWTDAAVKPWLAGESGRLRSLYYDGTAWNVHYDNGKLARSEDNGGTWDRPANSGLAADANYVAAYLG